MDTNKTVIHQSGEDYLETILLLKNRNGHVRSIDIAEELDYSKPSISRAMKILREKKYITIDDNGMIDFTDEGRKLAEEIYERHTLLAKFFIEILDVNEDTAYEDACRIEHVISAETFDKIKSTVNKKSGS